MKKILIIVLVSVLAGGCANFPGGANDPIIEVSMSPSGDKFEGIATQADRRLVITRKRAGDNTSQNGIPTICAEPFPDGAAFFSKIDKLNIEINGQKLGKESGETRNVTLPFELHPAMKFYRDGVFALCQAAMNGWVRVKPQLIIYKEGDFDNACKSSKTASCQGSSSKAGKSNETVSCKGDSSKADENNETVSCKGDSSKTDKNNETVSCKGDSSKADKSNKTASCQGGSNKAGKNNEMVSGKGDYDTVSFVKIFDHYAKHSTPGEIVSVQDKIDLTENLIKVLETPKYEKPPFLSEFETQLRQLRETAQTMYIHDVTAKALQQQAAAAIARQKTEQARIQLELNKLKGPGGCNIACCNVTCCNITCCERCPDVVRDVQTEGTQIDDSPQDPPSDKPVSD